MRGIYSFLIVLIVSVSLGACSFTLRSYTIEKGNRVYTVDVENNTISDGTNTYQYTFYQSSEGYDANIVYPDGSTFWRQEAGNGGVAGWSDDYNSHRFVDGDTLCAVLEECLVSKVSVKSILIIIVLFIFGIFNVIWPRAAWNLERGWSYRNAEPSDVALVVNRLVGIIVVITAIVLIFVWM